MAESILTHKREYGNLDRFMSRSTDTYQSDLAETYLMLTRHYEQVKVFWNQMPKSHVEDKKIALRVHYYMEKLDRFIRDLSKRIIYQYQESNLTIEQIRKLRDPDWSRVVQEWGLQTGY